MRLKIAFMYLDVQNIGDVIIYETSRYLLEDILKKNNVDYEIIPVDMGNFNSRFTKGEEKLLRGMVKRKIYNLWLSNPFLVKKFPDKSLDLLAKRWRMKGSYKHFMRYEYEKLEDADLIFFGGGGLIKFHRQNFQHYIQIVTEFADRKNIPVIFNAQGVEGYNEKDIQCHLLKRALNRKCVKYISTRDDIDTLKNSFITNPDIMVERVCDPAFWIPETYHAEKKTKGKTVGLNVIRTAIFEEYMTSVDQEYLGAIYREVIEKLIARGYDVDLFSNGVDKDTDFICWLFERYPELKDLKMLTVSTPKNTEEFVNLISGYDRFMAVRLHAAITGSVLGVPNVSLVWNRKQILFGELTNTRDNFIELSDFNADNIVKHICDAKPCLVDMNYKMTVYEGIQKALSGLDII